MVLAAKASSLGEISPTSLAGGGALLLNVCPTKFELL